MKQNSMCVYHVRYLISETKTVCRICMKFGIGFFFKLSRKSELCDNRCSNSLILLRTVNRFVHMILYLLTQTGEIQLPHAIEILCRENRCSKTIVHLRAWTKYFLYILHFSSDVDKYSNGRCSENYIDCEFCDSRRNERHTLIMRVNAFSFALVHIFRPVWVICVRDVCVILLIIW